MRAALFTFILIALSFYSCSDDSSHTDDTCATIDNIEEIPWLLNKLSLIDCGCEMSIIRGTYEGQTVIYFMMTDPVCDGISTPTLYACDGTAIRTFTNSPDDQQELLHQVTRDQVLFRCKR